MSDLDVNVNEVAEAGIMIEDASVGLDVFAKHATFLKDIDEVILEDGVVE